MGIQRIDLVGHRDRDRVWSPNRWPLASGGVDVIAHATMQTPENTRLGPMDRVYSRTPPPDRGQSALREPH